MGVQYSASLGYGVALTEDDVFDPEGVGAWEILERALADFPLITFEIGGGGYSSTDEVYALFVASTVQELNEVDGLIRLKRPKLDLEAMDQLLAAYCVATDYRKEEQAPGWLIVGGFH